MNNYNKYILILLFIMIIMAYSNTFHSPPVLDDFHSFIDEPLVKEKELSILQSGADLTKSKAQVEKDSKYNLEFSLSTQKVLLKNLK